MTCTFSTKDITAGPSVTELTVGLGRKFVLTLGRVRPGRITWTTENDPVLDLRESADKLSARVKATEIGVSNIYIFAAPDELRVRVRVVPMNDASNEAVTLDGKIGPEEPDA